MRRFAVLVAVAVATLPAACGSTGESAAPPKAAAETQATTVVKAVRATQLAAGLVDPGTYDTAPFQPSFRLTFREEGWRALFAPDDDEVAFEHEDGRFLAFTRVTRVVDPHTHTDVPAPKDVARWLEHHPALQPTESVPASVGGVTGTRIDTTAPPVDTELFWYPTGAMRAVPAARWRVIQLDVDGTPLTIVMGAPKASFEQGVRTLQTLLASIEFS